MAKPKRPKPIPLGKVRIRVHRGPRADGRWYWRADRQAGEGREIVWSGWGTPDEAEAATGRELYARGEPRGERKVEQVRTLHDLLDTWAASQRARQDVSEHTKRNAEDAVARLSGTIGGVLVERLDQRDIERHRDQCGDSGATIQRDLKYLRQAWRWGRQLGVVPLRDLPTVRVVVRPVRSRLTPTREIVALLLADVRAHSEATYRGVVLIAATGARPGEVCPTEASTGLRWGAFARDLRSVELVGKTGPREVQLHPEVTAELQRWGRGAPDELVCDRTDETVRRRLRDAAERLKLGSTVTPTGLRRYVTDALYDSGAGPDVESAVVGHSPEVAQRNYRRIRAAKQREAVLRAGLGVPTVEGAEVIDIEEARKRG